jgi:hypothetical protein
VEGVVGDLGQLAVGLDHQRDVGRLHRDLDVVEVDLLEVRQLHLGRLDEGLRSRSAVLLVQVAVEGAGVHADADRDAPVLGLAGHQLDVLRVADVAGVEPQTVDPRLQRGQRHEVVVVHVGHDRHRRAGHDLGQTLGGGLLVARAADDVGAGHVEGVDLGERALDVGRLGDRHRLDTDRRVATDRDRPHHDLPRLAPGGRNGSHGLIGG